MVIRGEPTREGNSIWVYYSISQREENSIWVYYGMSQREDNSIWVVQDEPTKGNTI